MAQKNELPALVAALLITAALLGGGAWVLKNHFWPGGDSSGVIGKGSDSRNNLGEGRESKGGANGGADGSSGQSILPTEVSEAKQKGLNAFVNKDYTTATAEFSAALQAQKNDPEVRIYLNNAEIGDRPAYNIAVPVPASSQFLGPALEIMRGVAQAQQDINKAGGIGGTPLKVALFNDEGQPTTAEKIASRLAADSRVLGVVGHYSSDTSLAAGKVYEAAKLAMISPTSTAVDLANAGDYIFRTAPSDRLSATALARYVLNDLNKTKVAVFYTGASAYSRSVQSEFTNELLGNGGEVVAANDVSTPGFSVGKAVQAAKQAGAEAILLALTEETDDFSLQILSVNGRQLPVVGGDSLYDFTILDVGRENAVGLTVAVPWHILNYQQSPFVKESQQLWGAAVNWRSATAYDAVAALAAAMKAGGATRAGIAQTLSGSSFSAQGATSQVRFFPTTGDRNQPSQLVTVVKKANSSSGTGYDYVPVPPKN
jgi:branched-chain amino acid transport system substrate-binding protein